MEEAPLLFAMQRIIGGIEVEDDLAGRRPVRLQKQIDEQLVHRRRVVADLVVARWLRLRQFQPVQRRFARHRGAVRPPRLELARQHRHQWIVPQRLVIVEVLVAEREGEYPLPDQGRHRMLDMRLRSMVDKARGQPIHHSERPVRRPQQQRARIRCDRTSVERRHNLPAFNGFKSKIIRVTLCLHRGSPRTSCKSFFAKQLSLIRSPDALNSVRYPG